MPISSGLGYMWGSTDAKRGEVDAMRVETTHLRGEGVEPYQRNNQQQNIYKESDRNVAKARRVMNVRKDAEGDTRYQEGGLEMSQASYALAQDALNKELAKPLMAQNPALIEHLEAEMATGTLPELTVGNSARFASKNPWEIWRAQRDRKDEMQAWSESGASEASIEYKTALDGKIIADTATGESINPMPPVAEQADSFLKNTYKADGKTYEAPEEDVQAVATDFRDEAAAFREDLKRAYNSLKNDMSYSYVSRNVAVIEKAFELSNYTVGKNPAKDKVLTELGFETLAVMRDADFDEGAAKTQQRIETAKIDSMEIVMTGLNGLQTGFATNPDGTVQTVDGSTRSVPEQLAGLFVQADAGYPLYKTLEAAWKSSRGDMITFNDQLLSSLKSGIRGTGLEAKNARATINRYRQMNATGQLMNPTEGYDMQVSNMLKRSYTSFANTVGVRYDAESSAANVQLETSGVIQDKNKTTFVPKITSENPLGEEDRRDTINIHQMRRDKGFEKSLTELGLNTSGQVNAKNKEVKTLAGTYNMRGVPADNLPSYFGELDETINTISNTGYEGSDFKDPIAYIERKLMGSKLGEAVAQRIKTSNALSYTASQIKNPGLIQGTIRNAAAMVYEETELDVAKRSREILNPSSRMSRAIGKPVDFDTLNTDITKRISAVYSKNPTLKNAVKLRTEAQRIMAAIKTQLDDQNETNSESEGFFGTGTPEGIKLGNKLLAAYKAAEKEYVRMNDVLTLDTEGISSPWNPLIFR